MSSLKNNYYNYKLGYGTDEVSTKIEIWYWLSKLRIDIDKLSKLTHMT